MKKNSSQINNKISQKENIVKTTSKPENIKIE